MRATIAATTRQRSTTYARRRTPARRDPLPAPRSSTPRRFRVAPSSKRRSNRIASSSPKPTLRGTTTARSPKRSAGPASKLHPRRSGATSSASPTEPPARTGQRSRSAHPAKSPPERRQPKADNHSIMTTTTAPNDLVRGLRYRRWLGRHQLVRGVTPSRPRIKYGLAPGCLGIVLVIVAIYVVILLALSIPNGALRGRRARSAARRAALLPLRASRTTRRRLQRQCVRRDTGGRHVCPRRRSDDSARLSARMGL